MNIFNVQRRRLLVGTAASVAAASMGAPAHAQSGAKPLVIYVGYPAGGAPDFVARKLADVMTRSLHQTVLVENRAGAAGVIAVNQLKQQKPDGHTIALVPSGILTLNPHIYKKLQYDAQSDLTPVANVVTLDMALVVNEKHPAKTLKEFMAWCKQNPTQAVYGVPGLGGGQHFIGNELGKAMGVDMKPVAYQGGPGLTADLHGGHIPCIINLLTNHAPDHRAGKLRVLATFGQKRSTLLPDVPTALEVGVQVNVPETSFIFIAPSKMSDAVKQRLADASYQALKDPAIVQAFAAQGYNPSNPMTQAEFEKHLAAESVVWREVVQRTGFSLES